MLAVAGGILLALLILVALPMILAVLMPLLRFVAVGLFFLVVLVAGRLFAGV